MQTYLPAAFLYDVKFGAVDIFVLIVILITYPAKMIAQKGIASDLAALESQVNTRAADVEKKLIAWRRDIHQHPELGDVEERTAGLVAGHLKTLNIEVTTGVARTAVIGILRGGKPGRVVALRADMDALPVKEPEGLPFASRATGISKGEQVSVMHACGHDAHTAMLMATAEVLAGMKKDIPGTIMFIFQPAEEGSSIVEQDAPGAIWGAQLILKEGWFEKIKPEAVFGLHVMVGTSGSIFYKSGATTASSDAFNIKVSGKGGHGGMPWNTIDPIPISALIISGLQTVVSRKADLTKSPAVITVATLKSGSNYNVVPDTVEMTGTIRAYDEKFREKLHNDIKLTTEKIAESGGGNAKVKITPIYGTTINDKKLADQMLPVLNRVSNNQVTESPLQGASEDFSFYAQVIPGLFIYLGITPKDQDPATAAPNHNQHFFIDETALVTGVRAMASMALNFLADAPAGKAKR